ncbi:MAG: hypothetical protein WDN76_06375 [Alphaproteobacteria bacterium]
MSNNPVFAPVSPVEERNRFAALFAALDASKHEAAADVVASWPRLVHRLALRGELATPWLAETQPAGTAA